MIAIFGFIYYILIWCSYFFYFYLNTGIGTVSYFFYFYLNTGIGTVEGIAGRFGWDIMLYGLLLKTGAAEGSNGFATML